MRKLGAVVLPAAFALALQCERPAAAVAAQTITAIDIGLEPDATMVTHAQAENARLLKMFPKGFSLDASHHPHVTILQRYVRTADLPKVYAADTLQPLFRRQRGRTTTRT
ncbi:MAG TPA: hypothetical protein VIX83_09415 [Candidatus Cybelea sp.]